MSPLRAAALLLLLPSASSYRGYRPFTNSAFFSANRTTPLPASPALDIADEAVLRSVLEARAFKGELLLFAFIGCPSGGCIALSSSFLQEAVEMVVQLNDIGFAHYVALGGSADACADLHASWPPHQHAGPPPSCVFSSAVTRQLGRPGGAMELPDLWATRYHALAAIAARGTNVFMHDLDMIFHSDPYSGIYDPELQEATLVCLREGPCNGGMMHVRNAAPQGAAVWALAQVASRHVALELAARSGGGHPGRLMDQELLGSALRVAATRGRSWDLYENFNIGNREHPFWKEHPQAEGASWAWSNVMNLTAPSIKAATHAGGCPYAPALYPAACERWDAWVKAENLDDFPLLQMQLHVPEDAEVPGGPSELLVAAPPWLWTAGTFAQRGWSYDPAAPPLTAMTHLLGTDVQFAEEPIGCHTGRLVTAMAAGYVSPLGSVGAAHKVRLLRLRQAVVDKAAQNESIEPLRELIRRFALLAALAGAGEEKRVIPLMPRVPCDAPWVRRSNESVTGVYDKRLVVVGGPGEAARCFVGATGWDSCWPWKAVAFAFDSLARNRTTSDVHLPVSDGVVNASQWQRLASSLPGDLRLGGSPPPPPPREALSQVQLHAVHAFTRDCTNYICPHVCEGSLHCDPFAATCRSRENV